MSETTVVRGVVALLILVGVAACGDPTDGASEGRPLFHKLCEQCHGPTGKPAEAMVQSLGVRDLTDPVVRKHLTVPRVTEQIRNGSANHRMPGFQGLMTDAQIDVLAAWVASDAFVAK